MHFRDRCRQVILFGRAYVWVIENGHYSLRPDVDGYTLFPRATRRAIERAAA